MAIYVSHYDNVDILNTTYSVTWSFMVIFVALIYPHRKIQIIIYSRLIMRFTQTKAAILDCRDGTTTSRNVSIWVYTIRMMLTGVSKPRNHNPFVQDND